MIDKDTVVDALAQEWAAIDHLVAGLDDDQWAAASPCPGWTVQDVVAHIIGTELGLSGGQPDPATADVHSLPHVRNDIGAFNEAWVACFRDRSPAQVLDRFRAVTGQRTEALAEMPAEEFHAPSWTPAGHATYARFMQIRVFDCWMHEQDIRDAVGRPGNEDGPGAAISIDEITQALGYVVGKRGKAPDGSSLTFDLTGPLRRQLHVTVDGRARVVDGLARPADVAISLPLGVFTRLCGGRARPQDVADSIAFEGDRELGRQIVSSLAFTI
ncbi:maleylpyruvate isomerase family mycothiol-dependent enzyme [Streptomyces sp. RB6PN25]|uniref:Maleylpyruvate isomerase family mycothiol-dependent enzyme n=1 Tax=Streptomyces humicola TaxID=2953240 RepID=A0ABT1PPB0_9ACTN|nr:maleylpyruvate isomerase family mycothiol-dependent enzyme [Streptomyces humicola]MCQ4079518.1 maleylpyruvate isomerase family mycothiol-dependent enzyme [Streptomyces humicola]